MSAADTDDRPPPEPFETAVLFGHAGPEGALLDGYRSGRQHHAIMLSGPRGVGKATLAYRFARFILANPDPRSEAVRAAGDLAVAEDARPARLIRRRAHPDLTVLWPYMFKEENKSGEIKVAHVRWVLDRIATTTDGGGWRVSIVDRADDLNLAAANALLKVLEEPPPRTVFLLVAERPGRQLATIRSRAVRLDLAPLGDADMRAAIAAAVPKLASDDGIDAIIGLAGGAPGMAISLARTGGLAVHQSLAELVGTLPSIDAERLHAVAYQLSPARADDRFRLFMDMTLAWLADLVRKRAADAPAAALEPLVELWDNVARAYDDTLALNLDRKQLILNTFFGLAGAARRAAPR